MNIFEKILKEPHLDDEKIISKYQEVAIRTFYYIYCHGSEEWTDPELMLTHDFNLLLAIFG